MFTFVQRRFLWLSLAYFLVALVQCTPEATQIPSDKNAPSWQSITPGQTTLEELKEILGEPDSIVELGKLGLSLAYKDVSRSTPDDFLIDFSCDCVVHIRINMLARYHDPAITLAEMLEKYGEPEAVTLANYPGGAIAFVYAKQGIQVISQGALPEDADTAAVLAIEYFIPMSLDEYMQTWGADQPFSTEADPSLSIPAHSPRGWEEYEYKP